MAEKERPEITVGNCLDEASRVFYKKVCYELWDLRGLAHSINSGEIGWDMAKEFAAGLVKEYGIGDDDD